MPDAAIVLARLREQPSVLEAGAEALIDDALRRPLAALLEPPEAIAAALAEGLRVTVASDALLPWLEGQIVAARAELPRDPRPLAEFLPPALPAALGRAAGRPFTPGRELVRAVLNHRAMRSMTRSILQSTLLEFGKRMWSSLPDTRRFPGAGFRARLVDMAKGVASVVSAEVERQLDDRVEAFVDGALADAIEMILDRLTDPRHGAEMAAWRADALPALLAEPVVRFVAEAEKVEPAVLAGDALAILRVISEWEGLEESLVRGLTRLQESVGARTLGAALAGSGLIEAWRPAVRDLLSRELRVAAEGEAFTTWLSVLLTDG